MPGFWEILALAGLMGLGALCGCRRDVRLAGKELPTATVRTVSHYGITFDRDAPAEQVAYAVLRAIREDVLAPDKQARQAALDVQFDLCAAGELARRNKTSLSRDEFIYRVVYRWAPTVSHYVHDFETQWERAKERLIRRDVAGGAGEARSREILMEVADRGGDPRAGAVLIVWLVRDDGYWRVTHLGFEPGARSLRATQSIGADQEPKAASK